VQLYFLKKDYTKVITINKQMKNTLQLLSKKSYSNTDAWTCYRIGESYFNTNDITSAIVYYRRASELAPYHLDILNKYATALGIFGDVKNARYVFEKIISKARICTYKPWVYIFDAR
jgi:tetratricopeptide (TPR) repeat protein